MTAADARREMRSLADPDRAPNLARFFQTGPGGYGEGDRFLGVRVPETRRIARRYTKLALAEVADLLRSRYHEERLLALLIMVRQYRRGDAEQRAHVFRAYVKNLEWINNWDLVDSSAHHIVGEHLRQTDRCLLHEMARSGVLWHRRIAVIATLAFIRAGEFEDTLALARELMTDQEDLIHKAVGWMLREVGKRDARTLEVFIEEHWREMPRTMLRYAVERFPESERRRYVRRGGRAAGAKPRHAAADGVR